MTWGKLMVCKLRDQLLDPVLTSILRLVVFRPPSHENAPFPEEYL